jgi:hypothetical protein
MDALEQFVRLGHGLPFTLSVISDAEALAMAQPNPETSPPDDALVHAQVDDHVVAAERVVSFGASAAGERAEVVWALVVVEDHGLVERLDIGRHPNTSRTVCSAATSASISSRVV